ncbi:MAG: hypothetical protein AAFV95_17020 [Bacteroidota bacterium]
MKTIPLPLLGQALLGALLFPPYLPIIGQHLWKAFKAVQQRQTSAYRRSKFSITQWTLRSLYSLLVLLGLLTVYVFLKGGKLIPQLESFY